MAIFEGRLKCRGPGLVGQWQEEHLKLTATALEVYPVSDASATIPTVGLPLSSLHHVSFDPEQNECVVMVEDGNWRLQGDTGDQTQQWTTQIQNQSGVFIQCHTISNVPKAEYGDPMYTISAKLTDTELTQSTGWVEGTVLETGFEECTLKQQLFLVAPRPRNTALEMSVYRQSAALVEEADENLELLGSFQIDAASAASGKQGNYKVLTSDGEDTGATVRVKVKGYEDGNAERRASAGSVSEAAPAVSMNVTPPQGGEERVTRNSTTTASMADPPAAAAAAAPPKKPAKTLAPPGSGTHEQDLAILDALIQVIQERSFRVSDLFRNKNLNPNYVPGSSEVLVASDITRIFEKVGIAMDEQDVAHLVDMIDPDGNHKLEISELENAIRTRKRGTLILSGADEKPRNSRLGFHRSSFRASGAAQGADINDPRHVLDAINSLLDKRHMRVADIFHHPHFNASFLESGDEELDAEEVVKVLGKAGLELSEPDVKAMMVKLDADGNGKLNIDEFAAALRAHRRGIDVTGEAFQKTIKKQAPKRKVDEARLHSLYDEHFARQKKLQAAKEVKDKKLEDEFYSEWEAEKQLILEQKKKAKVQPYQMKSDHSGDEGDHFQKMYEVARHHEAHRLELAKQFEAEALEKYEQTFFYRPRPRRARSESAPEMQQRKTERLKSLYDTGYSKILRRQRMKEATIATEISELDQVGQRAQQRGGTQNHHHLYEQAKEKKARLEAAIQEKAQAEADRIAAVVNARRARNGATRAPDENKVQEWHAVHEKNLENRNRLKAEKQEREEAERRQQAQNCLSGTVNRFTNIESRWKDYDLRRAEKLANSCNTSVASVRTVSSRGFGHSTSRTLMGGELTKVENSKMILTHEHAIAVMNAAVSVRCGCVPSDGPGWQLRKMHEPMKFILEKIRQAAEEVDTSKNPGTEWLKSRNNQRLFGNGRLMEDIVAWHDVCEPDPLQQIETDLDKLMADAQLAQAHLLGRIGPEDRNLAGTPEQFARRWPQYSVWPKPRVARMAQFAFNPGVKTREAARAKAFVRFAPSNKDDQYRQLLDLARVSLIFANATLLRNGLDAIIDQFEVVAVHNYYNPQMASIVTHKRIDVYVVVQDDNMSFTPHICEIRLEELPFHLIQRDLLSPLKAMGKVFCEMYENRKTISDPKAIQYLAKWSLYKVKERHSATVFRRHIANRFGSTVVGWRNVFGNGAWVEFAKFRDICAKLAYRNRTCEFWQEFDSGLAGNITLFQLDPDAVVLLARFYARLMGLVQDDSEADVEVLFGKLTARNLIKQVTPGKLELHEFRTVLLPLGFTKPESELLFSYLDQKGGNNTMPPATITAKDIAWLKRLPEIVDIDSIMLTPDSAATMVEHLRVVGQDRTTGRRSRMPTIGSLDAVGDPDSNMAKVRRSSAFLGMGLAPQQSVGANENTDQMATQLLAAWAPLTDSDDEPRPNLDTNKRASQAGGPTSRSSTATAVRASLASRSSKAAPRASTASRPSGAPTRASFFTNQTHPSASRRSSNSSSEDKGDDLTSTQISRDPEVSASESGEDFMQSLHANLQSDDDSDGGGLQEANFESTDDNFEDDFRQKLFANLSDDED